jgi:signal transduction histidine kinase
MTLLVALGFTWAVSRSLTVPLRRLTRHARRLADRELPDAVHAILETPLGDDVTVPTIERLDVPPGDEVAEVASALTTAHDSALGLAVEQTVLRRNIADSFVSLGRRNQNLLTRQIDLITHLEATETDSEVLSSLFHLDHLATRMRRNSESLLVLAGVEPPRYRTEPVSIVDVVRAAMGEVEDYQRAVPRGLEPVHVAGAVATDLAHILAELLENALAFSPPGTQVDVHGTAAPGGGYALAVVDRGFGMPVDEMALANQRLRGEERFTVAPSRYLGHYVAGNLASRHGIELRLEPSPERGVTAVVQLPAALVHVAVASG